MHIFLKQPKRQPGGLVPLFDRLINEDPREAEEPKIKKFYGSMELVDSLQREISLILSTRCNARRDRYQHLRKEMLG